MLITKLDAARRQIDAAIHLYFEEGDEIAVHTLVCAAHILIIDPEETFDFNPHNTELMLFIDIEMFKELTGSPDDAPRKATSGTSCSRDTPPSDRPTRRRRRAPPCRESARRSW